MIMARLKTETRTYHERLESDPLSRSISAEAPDLSYYMRAIGVYYGFYAPLERQILAVADWDSLGFDMSARRKLPLLERDLSCFGISGTLLRVLPLCPYTPSVTNLGQALGCMYVLEGATLGGQLISRHLAATLQLTPQTGAAFFSSYGDQLGPMWRTFRAFAEAHAADREETIVAAACDTFAALERWFQHSHAQIRNELAPAL